MAQRLRERQRARQFRHLSRDQRSGDSLAEPRQRDGPGFLTVCAANVMIEDAPPSLIGRQLGTYEVLSLLGAGGMGEVYRARDTKLNRDVALKTLPDAFARDADRLARFRREAQAVAALNHPHIVTIFSIEEHDAVPFMTMELIEGSTLDKLVPGGGLSQARFFDIAIALADALSAAHRKHIIHRDLKPANVMVTDDGHVKVLDFGLARAVDADAVRLGEDVTCLGTKVGTIVGTMPYMSPEQIESKPLDHRTDLFSLGILLYELATGERPFRGDSPAALMSSILKDHLKPVGERRSDLPAGVCRLVDQCLEKEPRDRIQAATEILAGLKAYRRAWETEVDSSARPGAPDGTPRPAERAASIAVLAQRLEGRRAHVGVLVQGQGRGSADYRREAERDDGARRQPEAGRGSRAHHRAAERRGQWLSTVVGAVRP